MRYVEININPWKYALKINERTTFFYIFTSSACSSWMWIPKITSKKWENKKLKKESTKILREN